MVYRAILNATSYSNGICCIAPIVIHAADATFDMIVKFLLQVQGLELVLRGPHTPELRVASFNDLIEKHLFRSMTFVR